jgi:3-hydroxyisobutyrate dehydrogenase-like beta-hydroxyacid dehydrogenase
MQPAVAIVAQGAMGAGVAERLTSNGVKVLTDLAGRSAASVKRAKAANMTAVPVERLADADLFLSILPPGDALPLAKTMAEVFANVARKPLYVDCNAVNPDTIETMAAVFEAVRVPFADGGIIGGPPKPGAPGPTFYLSGEHAKDAAVLQDYGIQCRVIDGPVGAASALKMSYGGITKGLTAIGSIMMLAAAQGGTAQALLDELKTSQPQLFEWLARQIPSMIPKAGRWVDEMQEVAGFVSRVPGGNTAYLAIAKLYRHIESDAELAERLQDILSKTA